VPQAFKSGDLLGQLSHDGYAVLSPSDEMPEYVATVKCLHALVNALVAMNVPPAFAYVYDITWKFLLHLWPLAEALLGGPCVLEPSFAAFRLNYEKGLKGTYVGNNFSKPHRDYSYADSIEGLTQTLKVLSVWVPLNDITTKNGCMYVVPRSMDPHYADPVSREGLQEPEVPAGGLRALAPHAAGSFMCWSGNTIHWGSACQREGAADPRASLALVFRRRDTVLSQTEVSISRGDVAAAGIGKRLRWVADAIHFFGHWYDVSTHLGSLLARLRTF